MAAGDQKLSDEQRELVAIGASIGAGCQPCVSYHLKAGAKAGVSAERLLAGVVNSELAAAEAAERLSDHARAQLGREVREPKVTPSLLTWRWPRSVAHLARAIWRTWSASWSRAGSSA